MLKHKIAKENDSVAPSLQIRMAAMLVLWE